VEICCNEVVWAYDDDNLEEAAKSIDASDTTCDDRITYDLDEDTGKMANSRAAGQP